MISSFTPCNTLCKPLGNLPLHTMKYQAKVGETTLHVERNSDTWKVNNDEVRPDWFQPQPGLLHVLWEGRSITVECVAVNRERKEVTLLANGITKVVKLSDAFDVLLHDLGMDSATSKGASDIKAPMPGLVLRVLVEPGQAVEKGDVVMVLEAMKMENALKSPASGTVAQVMVNAGDKVEKNALLIRFAS